MVVRLFFLTLVLTIGPSSAHAADRADRPASRPGSEEPPSSPAPSKASRPDKTVKETVRTTPAGGFTSGDRRIAFKMEFGYPFFDFQVGYGIGSRFQVFAGYRGLYTATHAPYGGIKVAMFTNPRRTIGLSFTLLGGWTYARRTEDDEGVAEKDAYYESLVGGSGAFGELWLSITARSGRHGVLIDGGVRVSQVLSCNGCESHVLGDKAGALATAFAEVGYEIRFMEHMSYYVAAGADFFANTNWVPALPRFRTGVYVDF